MEEDSGAEEDSGTEEEVSGTEEEVETLSEEGAGLASGFPPQAARLSSSAAKRRIARVFFIALSSPFLLICSGRHPEGPRNVIPEETLPIVQRPGAKVKTQSGMALVYRSRK